MSSGKRNPSTLLDAAPAGQARLSVDLFVAGGLYPDRYVWVTTDGRSGGR